MPIITLLNGENHLVNNQNDALAIIKAELGDELADYIADNFVKGNTLEAISKTISNLQSLAYSIESNADEITSYLNDLETAIE